VQDFGEFLQEQEAGRTDAVPHEFAGEGIDHLREALLAVADEYHLEADGAFQARAESMEKASHQLKEDGKSAAHPNLTRNALLSAGKLMENIQRQTGLDTRSGIRDFQRAARAVKAGETLQAQRDEVAKALRLADKVLRDMALTPREG
jgi:hypothetical protein